MLIGKKVQQHGLVAKPELNNTMGTMKSMMGYGTMGTVCGRG